MLVGLWHRTSRFRIPPLSMILSKSNISANAIEFRAEINQDDVVASYSKPSERFIGIVTLHSPNYSDLIRIISFVEVRSCLSQRWATSSVFFLCMCIKQQLALLFPAEFFTIFTLCDSQDHLNFTSLLLLSFVLYQQTTQASFISQDE